MNKNIERRLKLLEAPDLAKASWPKIVIMKPGITEAEAKAEAGVVEGDNVIVVHFVRRPGDSGALQNDHGDDRPHAA